MEECVGGDLEEYTDSAPLLPLDFHLGPCAGLYDTRQVEVMAAQWKRTGLWPSRVLGVWGIRCGQAALGQLHPKTKPSRVAGSTDLTIGGPTCL